MQFRIIAPFLLAFLMASCSHTSPPPPKAIPAPRQAADVSPVVDAVKADAAKSREISGRLEQQVDTLQRTTADLRQGFSAATAEAARLRDQKSASEKELTALWDMLNGSEARAKALFDEVEKAKTYAAQQREFRALAEKRLDELAKAAQARDAETAELRTQRDHFAAELDKAGQVHADMLAKLSKAEMKAAVGGYLKGIVWFIGIALLLVALAWTATKLRLI